jgi:hypothetical protein
LIFILCWRERWEDRFLLCKLDLTVMPQWAQLDAGFSQINYDFIFLTLWVHNPFKVNKKLAKNPLEELI